MPRHYKPAPKVAPDRGGLDKPKIIDPAQTALFPPESDEALPLHVINRQYLEKRATDETVNRDVLSKIIDLVTKSYGAGAAYKVRGILRSGRMRHRVGPVA